MNDPSPPATSAMPQQLLLQQQRQRQQHQNLLSLQHYHKQLMIQQQLRMHQQQCQGQQPHLDVPHQLQEPRKQHDHDQLKQPEQQRQLQQSQQQLLAMSWFPSTIDGSLSSGVESLQSPQKPTQQQTFRPTELPLPPHHALQVFGAGTTPEAAASKLFRAVEMDTVLKDASMVCNPDVTNPFSSVEDAVHRLLPYHILADYEAEEDDRILESDTTGHVSSRLQQWDQNIVAKMQEFTSAFEKQVQDFNKMKQKTAAGRLEERLMIEYTLLQEEKQAMLHLRAELEIRDRLERELAEANLRMTVAVGQARPTKVSVPLSNKVSGSPHFMLGLDSSGHAGEALAEWDGSGQVQCRGPSVSYLLEREVTEANLHGAMAQIDQAQAMVSFAAPAVVSENPCLVPGTKFSNPICESMVGWLSMNQGEHRDLSVDDDKDHGRWVAGSVERYGNA